MSVFKVPFFFHIRTLAKGASKGTYNNTLIIGPFWEAPTLYRIHAKVLFDNNLIIKKYFSVESL